jgi:hypothetical protein
VAEGGVRRAFFTRPLRHQSNYTHYLTFLLNLSALIVSHETMVFSYNKSVLASAGAEFSASQTDVSKT